MKRLISQRGNGGNISFVQNEPRGDKLFPDLTKPIGPDAEYRINGQRAVADFLCTRTTQLKISLTGAPRAHAKFDERASPNPVAGPVVTARSATAPSVDYARPETYR